jgi:L-arabinokinase
VPSVFFYISGHGLGHAARDIEVVNALLARRPTHDIVIRTSASRWLFDRTVRGPFTYLAGPCDTGVVQIDSLRLDAEETIRRASAFYTHLADHVEQEVTHLQERAASLVIADAPPLACAAAQAAEVPSIVLANFTWDWIYEGLAEEVKTAPHLIPTIQRAYSGAAEAWRLPLHGGFESFDRIVDLPFIARHASHDRAAVREGLLLPPDRRLALVSFGGYGVDDFDPRTLDCLAEWTVVITAPGDPPPLPPGVAFIDERRLYASGFRYEDVVGAVDVVVTKPGFGIVSECLANNTAMLYTSRGRFVEYEVMVAEIPRFLRCEYLPLREMLAGRWQAALTRLMRQPAPPERPRTDGAGVVAEMICEMIR